MNLLELTKRELDNLGAPGYLTEGLREAFKTIASEAIAAVQIPEPTAQDRKESPHWADTIDLQREGVQTRAVRFLQGL